VPVYAHQVRGKTPTKILPKPKEFSEIDEGFEKVASLFQNDYVKIDFADGKSSEGYYVKYGIASGQMALINHCAPGKDKELLKAISPRSAISIKRYDISILGDNAPER
jgi:hypothetical protein